VLFATGNVQEMNCENDIWSSWC